jgi:hypothetical protein
MVEEVADRRRSVEVRVKLSPALADEFAGIAAGRGLLPATLAAVALGEYVEKYRRDVQLQRMVAVDMSKRMSEASMSEEALTKAIEAAMANPDVLKAITDQSLGTGGA